MNSNFSLWKRGLLGSIAVFGVILISATGRNRDPITSASVVRTLPKSFDAPSPVREIIQRACLDCHSDATIWPWYSHIPPLSWQIRDDVERGRDAIDLSQWSEYTPEEQRSLTTQIAHATSTHTMPPPKYVWMHREARLSDADRETLKEWARSQAR